MTYEEFLEKASTYLQDDPQNYYYDRSDPKKGFLKQWTLGGTYGGAWGGGTYEAEPEPEWDALEDFLEEVCPDIRFLQYRKLMRLAKADSMNDSDYYSEKKLGYRWLEIETLYDFLNGEGLLK